MMGQRRTFFRSEREQPPELNLTSLIDILFIVLLFLLLSTTFREFTFVRVDLPEAASGEHISTEILGPVVISVDEHGGVFVDEDSIPLDDLIERLRATAAAETTEIILAADEKLDYGRVIDIMDRLRRAGYYALSLQTLTAGGAAPSD